MRPATTLAPLFALLLLAAPAAAAEPMTAEEFEEYVTGKTLAYSQFDQIFGVEEYLPGRQVRWQVTDEECQFGKWYEKEGLICFQYEYDLDEHCWTFWLDDGGLTALSVQDAPGAELSEVSQSAEGLTCPGPEIGV
jgi:hypothetical protein